MSTYKQYLKLHVVARLRAISKSPMEGIGFTDTNFILLEIPVFKNVVVEKSVLTSLQYNF